MRPALVSTLTGNSRIPLLLAILLLLGAMSGCSEKAQKTLDPRDELLFEQLRELAEIRVLAQEYPDSAQTRLDSFLAHNDTTGIHKSLAEAEEDPARGRFLLKALHDSLLVPLQRTSKKHSPPPVPKTPAARAKPRH